MVDHRQGILDHQATQALLAKMVRMAKLECQDHREKLVMLGSRDLLEQMDPLAKLVSPRDPRELMVILGSLVFLEARVRRDPRARLVLLDGQVLMVTPVSKDHKESRELEERED